MIYFEKIEVVNRLKEEFVYQTIKNYTTEYDKIWIYNKIHSEINKFCSQHNLHEVFIEKFDTLDESLIVALQKDLNLWAPGIEILSIRVTKPKIPSSLKNNFEKIEAEKTKFLITTEKQKVKILEANTVKMRELILAKSELNVTKIDIERKIKEKEYALQLARIENQIYLDKEKSAVDSEYRRNISELQTQKEKLTEEYLNYHTVDALTSNLELNLGEKIPQYYIAGDRKKNHDN